MLIPTEQFLQRCDAAGIVGTASPFTHTLLLETHSRLLNIYHDTPLYQKNLSIALHPSQDPLPQDNDEISWPRCSHINSFTCLRSEFSCFLLPSLVSFSHLPTLGSEIDLACLQTSPTSHIFKSGHELMPSILYFSLMIQPCTGRLRPQSYNSSHLSYS